MSQEVSKWIKNLLINGVYWGYNPLTNHLLSSWDIQVLQKIGHHWRLLPRYSLKKKQAHYQQKIAKKSYSAQFLGQKPTQTNIWIVHQLPVK